ncbi:Tryptophanyl-tRNA synthetase [Entamoeba marina]
MQTPTQLIEKHSTTTIDFDGIKNEVKLSEVSQSQKERIEKISGKPLHYFNKRDFIVGQRDLDLFLDDVEHNKPTYIFVSKLPNGKLSLNEYVTLKYARYLQIALNIRVIIQVLDDVKVLYRQSTVNEATKLSNDLIKDIIAIDFLLIKHLYSLIIVIMVKLMAFNDVQPFFAFDASDNIGKLSSPAIMAAPMYGAAFKSFFNSPARSIVIDSIENVQFIDTVRSYAEKLGFPAPAALFHKPVPLLTGVTKREVYSSTNCILMTDNPKEVERKINKVAFSGGRDTVEEHRRLGGDCGIDIPIQYLSIFESDDEIVKNAIEQYGKGELLSGELKKNIVVNSIKKVVAEFQDLKKPITNAVITYFTNWAQYRKGVVDGWSLKCLPEDFQPFAQDVICYAFYQIDSNYTIQPTEYNDEDLLRRIIDLKAINKDLEVFVAIGDGIDLIGNILVIKNKKRIDNHSNKHKTKPIKITLAIAANEEHLSGYNLKEIKESVSWFNLMTYDFHGKDALNYFKQNGITNEQIMMGIANYGRGWTIKEKQPYLGCKAKKPSKKMKFSEEDGFAAVFEIEQLLKNGHQEYDNKSQTMYGWNNNQFFVYDNFKTLQIKMKYCIDENLGGVMMWCFDLDKHQERLLFVNSQLE